MRFSAALMGQIGIDGSRLRKEKQPLNSHHIQVNCRPLYLASLRRFGSWNNALRAVGVDPKKIMMRQRLTAKEIKSKVKDLYRKGIDLAYPHMREKHGPLLANAMRKVGEGSWANARRKCGIRKNFRLKK